jgi:uncharacterized protein (DUF1501 family)
MQVTHLDSPSRRTFLQRSAQLAFTGAALPTALNLAAMGDAAAFNAPAGSYKALVCIFLYGGSDYANTVVTYDDPSYNAYNTIRGGGANQTAGGIAFAKAALTPTMLTPTTPLPDGRQYALHPAMTGLANLFNTGKAAVQLNVGPLVVPITKAQYYGSNRTLYPLPPKLFSHNDQQSLWQSSSPEGSTIGWGGNMGDLALTSNTKPVYTCISITGNSVFLGGDSALAYQVSTGGAVKINCVSSNVYGSANVKNTISQLVQQQRSHILENEYNTVTTRAISAEGGITSSIATGQAADGAGANTAAGVGTFLPFTTAVLTGNSLAQQLKMVARLIASRSSMGAKRQVFFVSTGGYDLHDNLLTGQNSNMTQLNNALTAFYQTTVNLGVADLVTSFTASDFGRTLTSNGDGSDHGWGSHHLIVGGAVKGKAFYGYAPPVSITDTTSANDQWHVGQGRLLPTTSVDQYAATLATWFGVNPVPAVAGGVSELDEVLPNLRNYGGTVGSISYPKNLGFMLAP